MGKKWKVIPKKIAGFKVPKAVRKSRLLRSLLENPLGRDIVANALTAGAGAAAAVLIEEREEIADATATGARRGAHTAARVRDAMESAADAAMDVIADAARSMVPETKAARKARKTRAAEGDVTRH